MVPLSLMPSVSPSWRIEDCASANCQINLACLLYTSLLLLLLLIPILLVANNREKYNFNSQWLVHIGDVQGGEKQSFADKDWKKITLPRAFNEDEAFKVAIREMTDTVSWYRKHFKLPKTAKGKKVFIEFERCV